MRSEIEKINKMFDLGFKMPQKITRLEAHLLNAIDAFEEVEHETEYTDNELALIEQLRRRVTAVSNRVVLK